MSNPYESPVVPSEPRSEVGGGREKVGVSVLMILVGLFFCFGSGYVLLLGGFRGLLELCRREGYFLAAYGIFYCFAGGLTSVFHVGYLVYGRPKQHLAGIWAIGWAVVLTGVAVVVLKLAA